MLVNEIFIDQKLLEVFDRVLPYQEIKSDKNENVYHIPVKETFVILVIQKIFFNDKKIRQVLFWVDGKTDFKLVNQFSSSEALGIFNTIVNILVKELEDIDIVFFTNKDEEKRNSLYSSIAFKFAKKYRLFFNTFKYKNDDCFVLCKSKLQKDEILSFIKLL